MSAPAVGIDLGTTYSCVAVFRNERAEIIANAQGNRTTPSVVSFGRERLIGEPAKSQEARNPENTVFGVKRLIGRKWGENTVQQDIRQWPFRVVKENGRPKIVVTHQDTERRFFPEEISAMVLARMKTTAETFLGQPVRDAVVTVPAYFNDSQRQATKDAATIAELNVLRIINEPTAAALAYGYGQPVDHEQNVLIFDLGGGTFDVSILSIEEGIFEVRATAGDTHLGGDDLDAKLTAHFAQEFQRTHGLDLRKNARAMVRLRTASERAKRTLSSASEATVDLDSLHEGRDFHAVITRARFEDLCGAILRRTIPPVRQALTDAGLTPEDIKEIVLVGGSTRVPMVQDLLREVFNGRQLAQSVHPDEAVAAGAAVQAASLRGELSETVTDLVLLDVTPLSLGTNVRGGIMDVIIPRNTPIPVKKEKPYTTMYDNQTAIAVEIREGERKLSKDNNLLGKYTLNGIKAARAGVPQDITTFEIDANGILHASSYIKNSRIRQRITINKGRLSKKEIERLINEARMFEEEDERLKQNVEAKSDLDQYCRNLNTRLAANGRLNASAARQNLKNLCEDTIEWLDYHSRATTEEYRRRQHELEVACRGVRFVF